MTAFKSGDLVKKKILQLVRRKWTVKKSFFPYISPVFLVNFLNCFDWSSVTSVVKMTDRESLWDLLMQKKSPYLCLLLEMQQYCQFIPRFHPRFSVWFWWLGTLKFKVNIKWQKQFFIISCLCDRNSKKF